MDEVRSRALRFIRLEEDKEIQKRGSPLNSYDKRNRKVESSSQICYNSKPYAKPDHHRVNTLDDEGEEEKFPKITDYYFFVDVSSLIFTMQDLDDKMR